MKADRDKGCEPGGPGSEIAAALGLRRGDRRRVE